MFRTSGDFMGSLPEYPTEITSDLDTRERFLDRIGYRMGDLPQYPAMLPSIAETLQMSRHSLLAHALEQGQMLIATDTLSSQQGNQYAWLITEHVSDVMGDMETRVSMKKDFESALEAMAYLSEFTYLLEMMDEALPAIIWSALQSNINVALEHMANITSTLLKDFDSNGMDARALSTLQSELIATIDSQRSYQQSHRNFTVIGIKLEDALRTYNTPPSADGIQQIHLSTYIKNKKAIIKDGMRCWQVKTDREKPFYLCTDLKKKKRKTARAHKQ